MDNITFSMASIPEREECLKIAIPAILLQADRAKVYLNNYEAIPAFLNDPKIEVARSQDHGDLKDNGKFFWLSGTEGYCFILDDDVLISPDYVERMIEKIEGHERRCVIANHGSRFICQPIGNYFNKKSRRIYGNIDKDSYVHAVGTGSIAFHRSTIEFGLTDCIIPEMTDVWFSLAAKRQGVPIIVIAERDKRLSLLDQGNPGLYGKYLNGLGRVQTRLINEAMPWQELKPL